MNFIVDASIVIDVVLQRDGYREKIKVLNSLILNRNGYIPVSSMHTIDYVIRKTDKTKLKKTWNLIGKLHACKTPSYIDFDDKLLRLDPEDYLVNLSAKVMGAKVITSDRNFIKNSDIAIHPDDFFKYYEELSGNIQFIDLKKQYNRLSSSMERNVDIVLAHGQFIMGPEIKTLEEKLAVFTGVKHCFTVANGTDALLIAMMALGVGHGDEVITTPFTFIATGEMIALLGAIPVFVDIDSRTYNIDPALIEKAITPKTKAIMPVSLYGQCADMDTINEIAALHGLPVIEDGAQSFGATYKGRKSCGLSTIGCTSFFPSKPLGCYGDGGACFTDDDGLAKRMREIRVHGQDRRYHHPVIGINGRMDTIQAAVVLAKLMVFEEEVRLRGEIGKRYSELLKDIAVTPYIEPFNTSVYAQYTIQVDERERLIKSLNDNGIPTAVHYPIPLNLQPAFAGLGQGPGFFPVAEAAAKRVLSLPMHPYLSEKEIAGVVSAIVNAYGSR